MIYIEDDLKSERGEALCKLFLKDGGVPEYILAQMSGPALDQFYHLVTNHKMGWRDAVRWVNEHKAEILEHDRKLNENRAASTKAD